MAGRYYPGVDSSRINRKAKALRSLMVGSRGPEPEQKVRSVSLSAGQWATFDGLGGIDWLRGELDSKSTPIGDDQVPLT